MGSDELLLWHFNPAFGSLGTPIQFPTSIKQDGLLTHLKFENKLRAFRPQGF